MDSEDKHLRLNEEDSKDAVPYEISEGFDLDIDATSENKPAKNTLAKRFMDLVGQGYKPHEAAKTVGTTMSGIMGNEAFKKQVKQLVESASMPNDIRKEMVRAGLNRIFMENVARPDSNSQKLAIEAAKAISSDPDVGLNAIPNPGIQININELDNVLAKAAEKIIDIKKEE